jgi:hypothetical protein
LQVDRGDGLPLGAPSLLQSFIENRHINPGLLAATLKQYDANLDDNIRDREDIQGPDEVKSVKTLFGFPFRLVRTCGKVTGGGSKQDEVDLNGNGWTSKALMG